ncbi:transcription factor p65-like isoform X3 [Tachypleus tridentatus]|uniref:transcription factor p65-like isoform X3 n=1 Tax=Tachypleus tridentatus TaxID=6853 RepID=UPI003FD489A4
MQTILCVVHKCWISVNSTTTFQRVECENKMNFYGQTACSLQDIQGAAEEVICHQAMDPSVSLVATQVAPTHPAPHVRILEQPASRALRFRYECEGRSAGSIPGVNSTVDCKTYPTIQVMNYRGSAVVVVSCVTKEGPPYRPHPHNLVGREGCKKGICTMVINNHDMTCSFPSLGIQCVKRKDIEEFLKQREKIKVDPYRTGFDHKLQASNIDLNVVRLCFQVFIENPQTGKYTIPLPPVVSDPIYDKKAMSELTINKLSHYSAPVSGGTEIILLCDKVTKDDIKVRFYEERSGQVVWEAFGEFHPNEVHKQVAISFRTPRYHDENVQQPVPVFVQLYRPSDGSSSDPRPFQLLPMDRDPEGLSRKRQKIEDGCLDRFLNENAFVGTIHGAEGPPTSHTIPRTIKQATRIVLKPESAPERKHIQPSGQFLQPRRLSQPSTFSPDLQATSGDIITMGIASPLNTCISSTNSSVIEHRDTVNMCSPYHSNTSQSTSCTQDILAIAPKLVDSVPKSEPSGAMEIHQNSEMFLEETTEKLDSLDLGIRQSDIQNILDIIGTETLPHNLSQSLFDSGNNLSLTNLPETINAEDMNTSTDSFSHLQNELEMLNVLCKSRPNESA